ncbi:MAG: DUF1631 family protein [Ectothiorhodospiraceae bacterium]|nr:DUF1631 family protein [Ectothiorhodospiraceae bacterium]
MTQNIAVEKSGVERRAFKRYLIHLDATIAGPFGQLKCSVRDFCTGGMLLVFENHDLNQSSNALTEYDTVSIRCAVPGRKNAPEKDWIVLEFTGSVVRCLPGHVGLRFVDPDLASLQLLQTVAKQQLSDAPADAEVVVAEVTPINHYSSQQFNDKSAEQLLQYCHRSVLAYTDTLATHFYQRVSDHLLTLSKATSDIAVQNAYFEALRTIADNRSKVCAEFSECISHSLNDYSPNKIDDDDNGTAGEVSLNSLSIVEDDVFDDWLADISTTDSIEIRYREALSALERRLSVLFDEEINNENNPYGPGLFSRSFYKVLEPLGMRHKAKLACVTVFGDTLLSMLGDLYQQLNDLCIEHGVLPVIEFKRAKPVSDPASEPNTSPQFDTKAESLHTAEIADTRQNSPSTHVNQTRQDPQTPEAEPNEHNLFQLFGELRNLQQNLLAQLDETRTVNEGASSLSEQAKSQPHTRTQADGNNALNASTVEIFNQEDISQALSKLDFSSKSTINENGPRNYRDEVIAMLNQSQNGTNKSLGVRESQIMDVASNIFHTLSVDQQMSGKVQQWIGNLELPMLKMALSDDALFTDRNHLMRQVINKIAQLEVLVEEENGNDQPAARNAIRWITDLVNQESDGSTEVFSRAVQQLDVLLKAQDTTYTSNLKKVVSQSQYEDNQLLSLGETPKTIEWEGVSEQEREAWIKRVSRLKEGDWLVFDGTEGQQRLRIAWIASKTQRIVFVNVLGVRVSVQDYMSLARMLYQGKAYVLDNVEEPAMDRAQYTMLQDLHYQLLHQSTHDSLTGLINRKEFEVRLEKQLIDTRHENTKHVVCFIGLDKFSMINNVFGYSGGDQMLREVSALLAEGLTNKGIIARLGSDEFGLLIQNCTLDDSLDFIEEHLEKLQEYRLVRDGKRLGIGCSVGLVAVSRRSESASDVLQLAESSCGVAKDMGGNRIQVYYSDHTRLSRRKQIMEWAAQIDRILEEDGLFLRCQSIVPVSEADHKKQHYEILLGVKSIDGTTITTPEFIEAAERYNRIKEVDRWVVKTALQWIADYGVNLGYADIFSINLSGISLNDENFLPYIIHQIKQSKVPVDMVCFEVTETAGIESLSDAAEFICEVKKTGCRFSLDDFGTGMSSYAYLKNLPVDFIKIDGIFVKDLVNNKSDYAVVKSICEIGHFMGMEVIAEYVENDQTLQVLRDIGVDYAQGFGIEKPHPLEELEARASLGEA